MAHPRKLTVPLTWPLFFLLFGICSLVRAQESPEDSTNCAPPFDCFDYVVVGGGTAGLTIASRLSEDPSIQVAVIEAGDFYQHATGNESAIPANCALYNGKSPESTNPLVEWGFTTTPQAGANGQSIHYARGKALGGSTALNFMAYSRTTAGALDKWAEEVGDESWTFDNVLPYYRKALNFTPPDMSKRRANATPGYDLDSLNVGGLLDLTYPSYAQSFSTWLELGLEDAGVPPVDGHTSGHLNGSSWIVNTINQTTAFRESSQTGFLTPVLDRPNLAIYKKTLAEKLVFHGKRAAGVQATTSDNDTVTLMAEKEVIVSAGVFQSPQLLLVSGIGPSNLLKQHNIEVVADRPGVGQNMNDHVFFGIAYRVNVETASHLGYGDALQEAVAAFNNNGTGPLASPGGDFTAFEKLPQEFRSNFSSGTVDDLTALPDDWPEIQYFTLPAFVGDFWLPGQADPHDGYNYGTILANLIAPSSRGNVSISSSSMRDQPLINPSWLTDETDIEVAIAAFKRLRQIYEMPVLQESLTIGPEYFPGKDIATDEQIYETIKNIFHTMSHASATNKMGKPDDPLAVVDPSGRVYGVENLRVADVSAFPFLPPGLPMGQVYMVAEKIADDIKNGR